MTDANDLLAGLSDVTKGRVVLSGVLSDPHKVEELQTLTAESRKNVLTSYVSLRVPWEEAVKSAEYGENVGIEESNHLDDENPDRLVQRRRIDALKPNEHNAHLFPDSLGEASIRQLADTMSYQRVPIEITPDGTIVDGERRWRAAKLLGWDMINVIVVGALTEEEIRDRVLDAYSSMRNTSLREKARIYQAIFEQLKRRSGRGQGRPGKTIANEIALSSDEIKELAALRAGLPSVGTATRLVAVFERGTDKVITELAAGEVSISMAYELLPKRPKKVASRTKEETNREETESNVQENPFQEDDDKPLVVSDEKRPQEAGEHSSGANDERLGLSKEAASNEYGAESESDEKPDPGQSSGTREEQDDNDDNDEANDDNDGANVTISVEDALEVLALHLEALAVEDAAAADLEQRRLAQVLVNRVEAAKKRAA